MSLTEPAVPPCPECFNTPKGRRIHPGPHVDREGWLGFRDAHVGASEVPSLMGLSPWLSEIELYARKIGAVGGAEESDVMAWGLALETPVARFWCAGQGLRLLEGPGLIEDDDEPRLSATPDFLVVEENGDGRILEVKTGGAKALAAWSDGPPLHHQVQLQVQMAVTGIHKGTLIGAIGGQPPQGYTFDYQPSFGEVARELVKRFWQRVESRTPPAPDASASAVRAIQALYPKDSGATMTLPPEAVAVDLEISKLTAEISTLNERKDELQNRLKTWIGDATRGALPDGSGFWKYAVEKRVLALPAKELPVEYTRTTEARRLRRVKA